jgi:hypothetical protein
LPEAKAAAIAAATSLGLNPGISSGTATVQSLIVSDNTLFANTSECEQSLLLPVHPQQVEEKFVMFLTEVVIGKFYEFNAGGSSVGPVHVYRIRTTLL